ncbi:glycohydrolase toxin TNT-related protein [Streptacidiphilus cavernicola]|uniref:Glycohydrolase toxin TNT-related protein n=1 Tax=Streptacidiphilus cavernicola TaxID=3342716 RepID=A0ABV6W1R0_9ACTN
MTGAIAAAAAASVALLSLPNGPSGPGSPGSAQAGAPNSSVSPGAAGAGANSGGSTPGDVASAQLAADVRTKGAIPVAQRDKVLGSGWSTSKDQVVTATGDDSGFHLLVAKESAGYDWKTAVTLNEPGLDADEWVGNTCTTPDGAYEGVVYAPQRWTNEEDTLERGGFAAVVNLGTGKVTKLGFTASLAYFDPGCGNGDNVVFSGFSSAGTTRLIEVNAATGKTVSTVTPSAEVTSAVPAPGGILAVQGESVIEIDSKGRSRTLATTPGGSPLRVHPAAGGAVFLATTQAGKREQVEFADGRRTTVLAKGLNGQYGLATGQNGQVYVTGSPRLTAHIAGVAASTAPAGAALSSLGDLAVTATAPQPLMDADPVKKGQAHADPATLAAALPAGTDLPVAVKATAMHSHTALEFYADPAEKKGKNAGSGSAPSPSGKPVTAQRSTGPSTRAGPTATGSTATAATASAVTATNATAVTASAVTASSATAVTATNATAVTPVTAQQASYAVQADDSTDTVDEGHYCAVARNDPSIMVYQPTPNQVEWAVDRAVKGQLTSDRIPRPSNWNDSGLSSWSPQGMFPLPALTTGGTIPPQVLLGVLSQESNLWQATSHSEPGEYGDPLIGNYYGANVYPGTTGYTSDGIWNINWANADCGYGIGQVTDGMRLSAHPKPGETELPSDEQKAVAVDYATNIAYAARLLAQKWNELHTAGQTITINNDDPTKIENWFAAVWDYNSGFNPPSAGSAWGLGWLNNPANPIYPADRGPFMDQNISCTTGTANTPATGWSTCSQAGAKSVTDGYSAHDAAQPQNWPYEEKVMGWAAESIDTGRSYTEGDVKQSAGDPGFSTMGFAPSWWNTEQSRIQLKPPLSAFCDTSNSCDPASPPQCEVDHEGASCDPPHWFHESNVTWKSDCSTTCGNSVFTFVNSYPDELPVVHPVTPPCGPPGGIVVNDTPSTVAEPGCSGGQTYTDGGTFSFLYNPANAGSEDQRYEGKEDLQQDSSGFGGHFWFAHTRDMWNAWDGQELGLMGTWAPKLTAGSYQVQAYLPYLGDMTQNAEYTVDDGNGNSYTVTVDQSQAMNSWVDIGYFNLAPGATVELTNETHDGDTGDHTIAFDAMRFSPVASIPDTNAWQTFASEVQAQNNADQDSLKAAKAHGADAMAEYNSDLVAVPKKGYVGIPDEFIGMSVAPSTVSLVGDCNGTITCTQEFQLLYFATVDTFYCDEPGAAADIGSDCPAADVYWTGQKSVAQNQTFTRDYDRLGTAFEDLIHQFLGNAPAVFWDCIVKGQDTYTPTQASFQVPNSQPKGATGAVYASDVVQADATGGICDQATEAGMQIGALLGLSELTGDALIADDPAAVVDYSAAQTEAAEQALKDLAATEAGDAVNGALSNVIDDAVAAGGDAPGSLRFGLTRAANFQQAIAAMSSDARALMAGYKPFGNLSIEKWFEKYWNWTDKWFDYPPNQGFEGPATPYVPKAGEEMDRFGSPNGQFLSPRDGTPFVQRALPPNNVSGNLDELGDGYHVYKWIKDWDPANGEITVGKIAPWFDQPGGGTQYLLPGKINVAWLKTNGYIEDVS